MWLTGLLGYPLGHTLSPRMHAAAFRHAGLEGVYVPYEVPPQRLAAAVEGLAALGVRGCNVTIPHKQSVLRYVQGRSAAVRQIGAANTLCWGPAGWTAHNTDVAGFVAAWRTDTGEPIEGRRFVLLGSGGAARAVLYGLLQQGAERVFVCARNPQTAAQLLADLGAGRAEHIPFESVDLRSIDGLVNTTPAGMHGREAVSPVSLTGDLSHLVAWDAIYNPAVTPFMAEAQRCGARAFNGLRMLAGQAAEAFRLWTGVDVPVDVFYEAALA